MSTEKKDEEISMACRNPKCDSMTATQLPSPSDAVRRYRCVKCGYIWGAAVGGNQVDLNNL